MPRSATLGDAYRYLIARAAFFNFMLSHEPIQEVFRGWIARDGWEARIHAGRAALAALAAELGLQHPWQLTDMVSEDVPDSVAKAAADRAVNEFDAAMEASGSRYPDELLDELRRLNVGWYWLATSLIQSFYDSLFARLRDITPRATVGMIDIPPLPSFTFEPGEAEPPATAATRFDEALQEFLSDANRYREALVAGLITPRGIIPQKSRKTIERDAGWFYRSVVCIESVNSIARSAGTERANVRRGIAAVRSLLEERRDNDIR